jgi:magnesium transporter
MLRAMKQEVRTSPFRWLDILSPGRDELTQLAGELGLPAPIVEDCLDPAHLPKWEELPDGAFLVLRSFDEGASERASTVQGMTRKIAIFWKAGVLVTVHRKDQPFLADLRQSSTGPIADESELLMRIVRDTVKTFLTPLENWYLRLEKLEAKAFDAKDSQAILREGYYLRRKTSVIKRLLRMTNESLRQVKNYPGIDPLKIQDVVEKVERLYFLADEIFDNINQLLSLEMSFVSLRTNDVVRVLTVFSAFFLPLTFIAGIYGMNFQFMPELTWPHGYWLALGLMAAVATAIYAWFKSKRWM